MQNAGYLCKQIHIPEKSNHVMHNADQGEEQIASFCARHPSPSFLYASNFASPDLGISSTAFLRLPLSSRPV